MSPSKLKRTDHSQSVKTYDFRPQQSLHFPDACTVTSYPVRTPIDRHNQVSSQMSLSRKESLQIFSKLPPWACLKLYRLTFFTWECLSPVSPHANKAPMCLGHQCYFACFPPFGRGTQSLWAFAQGTFWYKCC